jgi:hypothetical protein
MKKVIILAIILTITTLSLFAQAPPPPPSNAGTGGGPIGSGPMGAPIDGGLTVALLLGAGYALKQILGKKSS